MAKAEQEIKKIEDQISRLSDKILEKRPSHFRKRDIINSLFASLLFGTIFVLKGLIVDVSLRLTINHVVLIIILTTVVLTSEIYFIGYSRVTDKEKRKFGQFWAKRFFTLYGIALLVSLLLVYVYNINSFAADTFGVFKIVVTVSFPCAIAAAIPSLLKRY